ncbi:hypothetical protein ACH3Y9_06155 [Streptomyces sp. WSLK1-5]|uniref:hypothetical protein n=1 Tax=unclassified Streptomyces TaxID=2593676 RepID=UPI00378EBC79
MNDDELLARLRAVDPALTSKAPLPDVNRLVEAALNTDTAPWPAQHAADVTVQPARPPARRGRPRLFGLAAAAGLFVLAGAVTGGVMARHDAGPAPTAAPLTLVATGSAGAKCAEPVPDRLRRFPTLFDGTVTSVEGPSVAFRVDHWLQGGGADRVVLNSDPGRPEAQTFTKGERYVVAADKHGVVPVCGANMVSGDALSEFHKAFGK